MKQKSLGFHILFPFFWNFHSFFSVWQTHESENIPISMLNVTRKCLFYFNFRLNSIWKVNWKHQMWNIKWFLRNCKEQVYTREDSGNGRYWGRTGLFWIFLKKKVCRVHLFEFIAYFVVRIPWNRSILQCMLSKEWLISKNRANCLCTRRNRKKNFGHKCFT